LARLFIAFELPAPVLDAAEDAIRTLRKTDADVRWAARDHLHVTMRFLGEVPETSIPGVGRMLQGVCGAGAPLDLEVRGLGTFGGRSPRVVWAGVRGATEWAEAGLHRLRAAVDEGAAGLGFVGDPGAFTAHLTLGRVRDPRRAKGLLEAIRALHDRILGRVRVEELVLFQSRLGREGSTYTVLARAPLGPGPEDIPAAWLAGP
jgi:2'-5' RNA ligase